MLSMRAEIRSTESDGKGGVHQLEAVDPGVGHVREDLVEDRVNVVRGCVAA